MSRLQLDGRDADPPRPLAELCREAAALCAEAARLPPSDADTFAAALAAHLRAWRPVAVAPLGTLPPPGERIRDPRGTP